MILEFVSLSECLSKQFKTLIGSAASHHSAWLSAPDSSSLLTHPHGHLDQLLSLPSHLGSEPAEITSLCLSHSSGLSGIPPNKYIHTYKHYNRVHFVANLWLIERNRLLLKLVMLIFFHSAILKYHSPLLISTHLKLLLKADLVLQSSGKRPQLHAIFHWHLVTRYLIFRNLTNIHRITPPVA